VNVENVIVESWIASGKLFQMHRRPATAQTILHQINEVYVHSTWSFPLTADLIPEC